MISIFMFSFTPCHHHDPLLLASLAPLGTSIFNPRAGPDWLRMLYKCPLSTAALGHTFLVMVSKYPKSRMVILPCHANFIRVSELNRFVLINSIHPNHLLCLCAMINPPDRLAECLPGYPPQELNLIVFSFFY
jgi:hypothetical protein